MNCTGNLNTSYATSKKRIRIKVLSVSQKIRYISFIGYLQLTSIIVWLTFCGQLLEAEMAGARMQGQEGPAEKLVKGNDWHFLGHVGKVKRSAHNDGDEIESDAETFDDVETDTETDQKQNE